MNHINLLLLKFYFICRKNYILIFVLLLCNTIQAQEIVSEKRQPCILFPSPMYDQNWQFSIGFSSTTTPEDITEEVRVRVPAGDWRVLYKLNSHFNLDGRLLFQIVQNHVAVGLRWSAKINDRIYLSAGDDVAFWFGKLTVAGFDSKGNGWMNYPNVSIGYRTKNDLLFTLKTEAMINTTYKFTTGGYEISKERNFFNGFAYTIALEQPFYNKKHLTLSFTAMYADFFWETWSLFETFDRKIFYPQITVGFII